MDTGRAETRRCHGDHKIVVLMTSYSAAPPWIGGVRLSGGVRCSDSLQGRHATTCDSTLERLRKRARTTIALVRILQICKADVAVYLFILLL